MHGPRAALLSMLPLLGSAAQEPAGEDLNALLARMRPTPTESELLIEDLTLDLDRQQRRRITAEEAAQDAERLFEVLAHGYSGYGFFDRGGRFEVARKATLAELASRESWRVADLPPLFRSHLEFVRDCHTRIEGLSFGGHQDLWLDHELELHEQDGAWRFESEGTLQTLVSVDGRPPRAYVLASLSAEGEPIHRLGVLSVTPPAPLVLEARGEAGTVRRQLRLQRSVFEHWADDLFREDRIGGIGVLRVRSFGDADPGALRRFVESAERYRDEPCVVVDLRGNRGGNERWASDWIERLTGQRPRSIFVFSELESRTTMVGRLNAHAWWDHLAPGVEAIVEGVERYRAALAGFGPGGQAPRWTGPFFPDNPVISNATTVVVVTNGLVASAGEGFVMRMRQAENVIVVGENTHGALTFGNVSLHQLPCSGLKVWMPINLNVFPDLSFREEQGLFPDWWVPAGDAVNCTIAALRRGAIPTVRPFGEDILSQPFVPEDPWHREHRTRRRHLLFVAVGLAGGGLLAVRMRRRPMRAISMGVIWLVLGAVWLLLGRTRGPLLTDGGLAFASLGTAVLCAGVLSALRGRAGGRGRGTRPGPRPG